MKKILALGLAFALVLPLLVSLTLLAACANTSRNPQTSPDATGTAYKITDYYTTSGSFSARGLALKEENSEKVLTVNAGDTLVVSGHTYRITDASITLSFYTQPSLNEVIEWWTDYCERMVQSARMTKVS